MSTNEPESYQEPVEFAARLLDNKAAELEIAARELEHTTELSKLSIAAAERDRIGDRQHGVYV
ncbi:MAG: hypothetical protein Q4G66_12390 [bacterium]|nr:hypothetical protein [bacterium]